MRRQRDLLARLIPQPRAEVNPKPPYHPIINRWTGLPHANLRENARRRRQMDRAQ